MEVSTKARTVAAFAGGIRLSDHLSVSVIVRVYPLEASRAALRPLGHNSLRRRDLPAEVMVCYLIAMAPFRTVSAREVLEFRLIRFGFPGLFRAGPGVSSQGIPTMPDIRSRVRV